MEKPDVHPLVQAMLEPLPARIERISNTEWRRSLGRNRLVRESANFLLEHLPSLAGAQYREESYCYQYGEAMAYLKGPNGISRRQFRQNLAAWSDLACAIGVENQCIVTAPDQLHTSSPSSDVLSKQEFDQKRWLNEVLVQWLSGSKAHLASSITPNALLGEIATSAVFRSAIQEESLLLSFFDAIFQRSAIEAKQFSARPPMFWVGVSHTNGGIGNVYVDGELASERQLYLDPLTVALVHRLWGSDFENLSQPSSGQEVLDLLKVTLGREGSILRLPNSLGKFLRIASGSYINLSAVPVSEAMMSAANGRQPCITPRTDQWNIFLDPVCRVVKTIRLPSKLSEPKDINKQRKLAKTERITAIQQGLYEALKDHTLNGAIKRSSAAVWEDLRSIDDSGWPRMARWLKQFYMQLLCPGVNEPSENKFGGRKSARKQKPLRPSTVRTGYHYLIGTRLLQASQSLDDDSLTINQMDRIFELVLGDAITSAYSNDGAAAALNLFSDTIRKSDTDFPGATPLDTLGKNRGVRVRTGMIPVPLYQCVRQSIMHLTGLSLEDRETLQKICDIMYWAGSRPSDLLKVRIRDLEEGEGAELMLAVTVYGFGKTDAAARILTLGALLLPELRSGFSQWANRRRARAKLGDPLFECGVGSGCPWSSEAIGRILAALLRACGGLDDAIAYDFRHTRLSAWEFFAEGQIDTLVGLGMYSHEHALEVSAALLGPLSQTAYSYSQLITPSGHSTASIYRMNYCHGSAAILGGLLATSGLPQRLENLVAISGITRAKWRNQLAETVDVELIGISDIAVVISKLLPLRPVRFTGDSNIVAQEEEPAVRISEDITLQLLHQILNRWKEGATTDELAEIYGIESSTLERWCSRMTRLCAISNRQGVSRLTGNRVDARPIRWAPHLPHEREGEACAEDIRGAMRRRYRADKERFRASLKHFFRVINHDGSAVRFTKKQELKDFLWMFDSAIDASRWSSTIECASGASPSALKKYWRHRLLNPRIRDLGPRRGVRNRYGAMLLRLGYPKPSGADSAAANRDYSSMLLKYIMPLIAMLVMSDEDLTELGA